MQQDFNEHVSHLPKHLLEYVVDQNYIHYTAIDQAVWRYVMRQNVNYLPSVCHGSYLEGLEKTGISIESIPSMYGMSRILKDIGWYAVAVDGFIPPTIFMEFQAHNVLVIAADIRRIDHIGYTPAPDILHEAAGHAPIIADPDYADYLKRFGEIGSKAFSSSEDMVLFEAIRELSILKEAPQIENDVINQAEKKLLDLQNNLTSLSEMAKIRNLHWWTVEYGLIGKLDSPKIYGAGLLSSISESVNCLSENVLKIPYTIDASNVTFDITKEQPQLFVAKNFKHLNLVLDEFSNKMAYKVGGDYAIELAIDYPDIATCVLDSGVQISGLFQELIKKTTNNSDNHSVVYLKTNGPTALSYNNKEIQNHGVSFHRDGFGCPIGEIINIKNLNSLKNQLNKIVKVKYDTGVEIEGCLFDYIENDNQEIIILSFKNCIVKYFTESNNRKNESILFEPSWGIFDLLIGEKIISSYPGAADKNSFPIKKIDFKSKTIQPVFSQKEKALHDLYASVRDIREFTHLNSTPWIPPHHQDELLRILELLKIEFKNDWLLTLEICELTYAYEFDDKIYKLAHAYLMSIKKTHPQYQKLILDGLNSIDDVLYK